MKIRNNGEDLTDKLKELESKDQVYEIGGTIVKCLAPQDPKSTRPIVYHTASWGEITKIESYKAGSPKDLAQPLKKKRVRRGEGTVESASCWAFRQENGHLLLPWSGSWGLFKQGLRRMLLAKNRTRYDEPAIDLLKIYPKIMSIKAPADSNNGEDKQPIVILTPRNKSTGKSVRVNEFFDYIENRDINFYVRVDSENPINEEKLIGMLKSFNSLDSFGPSKRGTLHIETIRRIPVDEKTLSKLEEGKDIDPPTGT